jgi:hypothetical protein
VPTVNNYLKVSRGISVVELFPFNDDLRNDTERAREKAMECYQETLREVATARDERAQKRQPTEVVRVTVFRRCETLEPYGIVEIGTWKCPKCSKAYDGCKC